MEELSIEKAKRYDEAIERAKEQAIDGYLDAVAVKDIFPELAEPEDERIKKAIRTLILSASREQTTIVGVTQSDMIAWLEKKGEQKPVKTPQWMIDFLNEHRSHFGHAVDHDERRDIEGKLLCIKQWLKGNPNIEQKHVEWSEEDEYHKRQILRILKENGCSQTLQEKTEKWIEERLKSLRLQTTWKPSEEQMTALRRMKAAIAGEGEIYKPLNLLYEDLQKLREDYGSAEDQWQPAKSLDEAVSIVKAHPITKEMTYEERLAAQKARFGL